MTAQKIPPPQLPIAAFMDGEDDGVLIWHPAGGTFRLGRDTCPTCHTTGSYDCPTCGMRGPWTQSVEDID